LAIGTPQKDVNGKKNVGAVYVLTGSTWGLAGPYRQWTISDLAALGVWGMDQDSFGKSLSAGNVGHDGKADLVIGIPYRDVNGVSNAGAAAILFGRYSGLSSVNAAFHCQMAETECVEPRAAGTRPRSPPQLDPEQSSTIL
jgi:hypothetical protein